VRRPYPKLFRFEEKNRSGLTFSDPDKIRLNPETNRLELKAVPDTGRYPTDADLHVKSWVANPLALKGLTGFHADPLEVRQPVGTAVRFRLGDGTTEYYHDGAAWVAAGPSDWNTEAQVATNIASFPIDELKLQVIVNLATADDRLTPTCDGVAFMLDVDLDYMASIIGDSLAPSLREAFHFEIDHAMLSDAGGTKISLRDLESAYNVLDVTAAYDSDADPKRLTNILQSYDAATMIVTLSSSLAVGTKVWLKLEVEPETYVNWGSQDFIEVEKLPAIVVDGIDGNGAQVYGRAEVRDAPTNTAKVLRRHYRVNLVCDVTIMAPKNRPLFMMMDMALEHAHENAVLRWRAVDERISLRTVQEINFRPRPDLRDEHGSSYSLRLDEINMWLGQQEVVNLVEQFNISLTG
jgi:hypothetical protein